MSEFLPPDLSAGGLAFLLATAFIASTARGFSGFGAALIFLPLAATVVDPKIASPLLLVTDAVLAAGFIPNAWRGADKREVGIMGLGAAIGIPLGTVLLVRIDPLHIRWAIVGLAAAMLALLVSGWRYRGTPTRPLTFGVGTFAGVCSGAAQIGGPAVIAYWLGSQSPPAIIRANIILYFSISTAIALVSYFVGGVLTLTVVKLALVVGPVYGIGLFLGSRLFGVAHEALFRRICYALIVVAVVVSLPLLDGVIR
ncbi:MAG TPA: sulfite exporter TauE/SafE family protein [Xanthobacteraceae bacterium]|nr:sulfite exporter TauE/SafE family protein [Xanthobacteraceae bacterium]